ncbi:MAG: efflux transporter outer membrane subunit [Puniceicoccaceae bacterium]
MHLSPASRHAVLAMLLLAAGCASDPRPLAEEAARERVPELGSEADEPVPDYATAWTRDFGDPRLAALIERTLAENPDTAAAAARMRAAAAAAVIAGADRLPQASADFGASRGRTVTQIDFPGVGETIQADTRSRFELGLSLSWEIDLWGRLADARRAALFDGEATAAQAAGTRLALSAAVSRAWFRATALTLQESIAKRRLEVAGKSLRATEDRVNRGLLGSLELSLARSQVEGARSTLQTRTRDKRDAYRLVQAISGAFPDGGFTPPPELPDLDTAPPPALPSTVLARRPDLLAAAAEISAADSRARSAEKSLIPALSLSGGYGTASDDLTDLLDSDFTVWNLAGNLLQPIFQGGRLRARVEQEEALLAAAIADFESALLTALREVEDALDGDAYLREAASRARRAAELAGEAAEVGFARYERGLIDLLDVLELQDRAFEAYTRAIDLRLAALLNRIDLYAAIGGGFTVPDPPPDPTLSQR